MGASIPEMLTFESKREGSQEVRHAYNVEKRGDLLIMAEAEGPGWMELRCGRKGKGSEAFGLDCRFYSK